MMTGAPNNFAQSIRELESAIQANPENHQLYAHLGRIYFENNDYSSAIGYFRHAIEKDTSYTDAYLFLGIAQRQAGLDQDAISTYRNAIEIRPDFIDARYNLALILYANGNYHEARQQYKSIISLCPDYIDAYNGLGLCEDSLGNLDAALSSYQKGLDIDPESAILLNNVASVYLALNQPEMAMACFKKSANLRYNNGCVVSGKGNIFLHRIRHDAEQLRYLISKGIIRDGYNDYLDALSEIEARYAHLTGENRVPVDENTFKKLSPSFNKIIHYSECPEIPQGVLNENIGWEEHEDVYLSSKPEVVIIDDFLTSDALGNLYRFCLESTVWKTVRPYGYMGALIGSGLASPLLLQLIRELKEKLPRILGTHNLVQAWAYKYDNTLNTINIHADCAAVNVNFWITPDSANLNPENGGLILWDKLPPDDWDFKRTQNPDKTEVLNFLKTSGASEIKVPYKQNRMVLFNSALFHKSDKAEFAHGYENRRMNVTLLYGAGLL